MGYISYGMLTSVEDISQIINVRLILKSLIFCYVAVKDKKIKPHPNCTSFYIKKYAARQY